MRSRTLVSLGSFLSVVLCASVARGQTTWYVNVAGSPPGTGTLADPYTAIQYAISRPTTVGGDTLLVAAGTYLEHIDFLGKAIEVKSSAGAAATILDGSSSGSVVSFVTSEGPGSVLDGFTVRHGAGTGAMPDVVGGGVRCVGASPILKNLVVRENKAILGSGVYLESSTAQIQQCTLEANNPIDGCCIPSAYGMGIYSKLGSSPTVTGTIIRNNTYAGGNVNAGAGVFGGGTFVDCTIEGNRAFMGAGVYAASGGNPHFVNCIIRNNMTASNETDASAAGGVWGPAILDGCTLTGNSARFNGGGAYGATLNGCLVAGNTVSGVFMTSTRGVGGGASGCTLTDCEVRDNVANGVSPMFVPGEGGGIFASTATRCRIWRNQAQVGGGASNSDLKECTVYGNSASGVGGGLLNTTGNHIVRNSIVRGSTGGEITVQAGTVAVTYSDVQGGYAGIGNIDANPLFYGPLSGDFHLKPGSPCIDTGDPTLMDPDTSRIDMGAIPFVPGYCGTPGTYCVAKVNSHGCTPVISFSGMPTISGADNFFVTGSQVLNQRSGLMIWSSTPATLPALGGTLCVSSFKRTPAQNSGGTALPVIDCSGTYGYFFSQAYMGSHSVIAGSTLYAQYYARDPFQVDGTGASLSNGLEFTVCP
jgi:hypothetical protein